LTWKRSTIWIGRGNSSCWAIFQIQGAPSPRTTVRSAWASRVSALQTMRSLTSCVLALPSGCLPERPCKFRGAHRNVGPSRPRYSVTAAAGHRSVSSPAFRPGRFRCPALRRRARAAAVQVHFQRFSRGVASQLAALTASVGRVAIRVIGIEALLKGASGQKQRLSADRRFQGFQNRGP
jgi:hypothetical protein